MIIAFLLVPVAIGFVALAVEGGAWYADRHELRAMVDASAMVAGWAERDGNDDGEQADAVESAAAALGYDASLDDIVINEPPDSGDYAGVDGAIEVIVTRTRPLALAQLFLDQNTINISMRAVVLMNTRSAYCVLALSSTAAKALEFSGNPTVTLNGCGVTSNSSAANALYLGGSASLTTAWAQVHGQISGADQMVSQETPETGATTQPDPFADLPVPARPADCPDPTSTTSFTSCAFNGDVTFNSGDAITLAAGTYYVDGGTFRINGGASLVGSGVTIYLTNGANLWFNGGATVNLTAPSSGTYAGIAIYQDRTDPAGTSKFNGGSTMDVQGAIYMPTQDLEFTGGNALGGNGCTRVVANTVSFGGNADMGNNCSGLGLPTTIDDTPRLVE